MLRRAVGPTFARCTVAKRGPKRAYFVQHVAFAELLLCNMLYRGVRGVRWHMGCNDLITKRRHGFAKGGYRVRRKKDEFG